MENATQENVKSVNESPCPVRALTAKEQAILKNYNYHKPSTKVQNQIADVRLQFKRMCMGVLGNCPDSRERSLALTALEDARMYAILSLAVNDPEGEVIPDGQPSGLSGARN